jgi:predicted transcriptional regulator
LLAKLPLLSGLEKNEVAELPDDRRRLEAEAFVKGIQGEVLDLVARRQILAARIKSRIESKNKTEADELLNDLRKEKSYDKMQEELDALQRRILSSDRGPITPGTQLRIDKMFDTTRQMLQKYLQDKLLRDLEIAASKIGS